MSTRVGCERFGRRATADRHIFAAPPPVGGDKISPPNSDAEGADNGAGKRQSIHDARARYRWGETSATTSTSRG